MKTTLAEFTSGLLRHLNRSTIEEIAELINQYLPSGSGFDNGTTLNLDKSTPQKLVFDTSFHHMSEHGYYTRWTDHTVTVRPEFNGLDVRVSGRDHNGIKDFITECFEHTMNECVGDGLREEYVKIARENMKGELEMIKRPSGTANRGEQ